MDPVNGDDKLRNAFGGSMLGNPAKYQCLHYQNFASNLASWSAPGAKHLTFYRGKFFGHSWSTKSGETNTIHHRY